MKLTMKQIAREINFALTYGYHPRTIRVIIGDNLELTDAVFGVLRSLKELKDARSE